jgi:hypothetical protein
MSTKIHGLSDNPHDCATGAATDDVVGVGVIASVARMGAPPVPTAE